MSDTALVQLDRARVALAECKTAMEAKQIADAAEAARVYLERTNASVETVNRATEVRLLAERQMGKFLADMPKNHGARGVGKSGVPMENPTMEDIGITKRQSHQSQRLAAVPEEDFAERLETAKATGERLSARKIIMPVRTHRRPNQFSLDEWKTQTRSVISLRLRGVPPRYRTAAIDFLATLAAELSNHEPQ